MDTPGPPPRIAFISDIHSNLEALEAVLTDIGEQQVEAIYCLGDVVGYGPNPRECLAKTREVSKVILKGNHDQAVGDEGSGWDFSDVAQAGVAWTRGQLSDEERKFLADLPYTHILTEYDMLLVHATPERPEEFRYLIWDVTPSEAFAAFTQKFCFVGHSHVPAIYAEKRGQVREMGMAARIEGDARYLVNVGSVGQPRDGIPLAAYCFVDFEKGGIEIRRIEYDFKPTQLKILAAGLPSSLASRLSFGK